MAGSETEVLARVLMTVSVLSCVGWAIFGLKLKISRSASLHFSLANGILVVGDLIAMMRHTDISFVEFYKNFSVVDLTILAGTMLFRSGMRNLYGLPCTEMKDYLRMAIGVLAITVMAHLSGIRNAVGVGVYLSAACIAFKGYIECSPVLRQNFGRTMSWHLLWPVVAAGVLFLLRALDDTLSMLQMAGELSDTVKEKNFASYLWGQFLVLILLNASLIGQTLAALIKRLNDQTNRLQNILDTAPVGVAVSTDGIIRFANPMVSQILDMNVGDVATKALVRPEAREEIIAEMKAKGTVSNMELQMFCPRHSVRDLLVTYLPTEYEGKPGVLGWMVDITDRKKDEKKILFNRTVVENSEPMFWADPDTLTVVYANKAGLALMEQPFEKVIGIPVPPQFRLSLAQNNMPALVEKLRDVGHPLRFETRHVRANGEVLNIDVSCYVAEDEDRTLLVASLRDITEQKRAEQALRQINDEQGAIFDSATMGIAFIKEWKIIRGNHRLDTLFGWDPGEMVGQSPRVWYPPEMATGDGPYADLQQGAIHYSTQELLRKDGSRFWCRLSGAAIDHADLNRGSVWMFDDVTDERRAAELMREAKEMAEDATRMKSDFLANMSHEIRTPMNAIIGMAYLALQTDLNARQRNYIEKVDSAARNLLGIINDILDFSKIEAGKMRFEVAEFHLDDVMENLADLSVIKAQDKGLELLFDVDPDVPTALVGDSLRLGQVLINLVGNAIKFTESGEITVGIHAIDPAANAPAGHIRLRFDITDTGMGLTPEQQEKLFSAFSQADASTTRKYGGTGLGLTISKRLVELMDGEISVQSQLGQGSSFSFTAQFGLQEQQHVRSTLDPDVTGLRILVVDDNARAREIMLAILASQKFDAQAVSGGAEAITALESAQAQGRPYGLVLMDWMMPGMDGLTTIQRIRANPAFHGVPAFVMVTAHSRDEFLEQANGTPIDGLLFKPVNPSALLDGILCALGKDVVTRGRKQQRQEASLEAQNSVRGAYLLLVEDNAVNQELALEILQGAGIRVDLANNGAEAVAQVGRHAYDGVLMDCQMPVMDGFEATRRIRAEPQFASLPILAMTANAMSGDRELCLQAGMNDHIGKPIDVAQLFNTLARWIKPSDPHSAQILPVFGAREGDLPAAIAGLDLALAMRRMGSNAALVRKLMIRFAETQAGAMSRIQTALASDDRDTALREAHTVKGLAGNIGAQRLMGLAADVEASLKHEKLDVLPLALEAMAQALTALVDNIVLAMGSTGSAPSEAADPMAVDRDALAQEIGQLAELLAQDDVRAGNMAEGLAGKLTALGQGAAGKNLQKLIGRYEFEEALEKLHEMAAALNISITQ